MRVHRLVKARHAGTALDGEGARRVGGRWNAPGQPVAYCASSLSLAVLELLVHVDPGEMPADLVAVTVDIPDDAPMARLRPEDLPSGWQDGTARVALQAMGAAWLRAGQDVVLIVPSAIVPAEHNILVNPGHPDAGRIQVTGREPFALDARLLH